MFHGWKLKEHQEIQWEPVAVGYSKKKKKIISTFPFNQDHLRFQIEVYRGNDFGCGSQTRSCCDWNPIKQTGLDQRIRLGWVRRSNTKYFLALSYMNSYSSLYIYRYIYIPFLKTQSAAAPLFKYIYILRIFIFKIFSKSTSSSRPLTPWSF